MTQRITPTAGFWPDEERAGEPRRDRAATVPLPPSPQASHSPPPSRESVVRVHCERSHFDAATRIILDSYGAEVRAFLKNRTHNRTSMDEVYAVFSEDLWKGLPSFRFEGKVRSWVYSVARRALYRHVRSKRRWGSRHVSAEPDELQAEIRRSMDSRLAAHSRLEPLLSELRPEDRRLLEMRLVLSMEWRDIASECAGGSLTGAELERESARLRKRYQSLVERLRKELAASRGSLLG